METHSNNNTHCIFENTDNTKVLPHKHHQPIEFT